MNIEDAGKQVAESGRMLLDEGLTARTWGNISCRVGGSMLITPSGLGYESMTGADVVTVDLESGKWSGSRKPSSEKGIHIAAYAAFPEAGFVIHTHQTYASAIYAAPMCCISFLRTLVCFSTPGISHGLDQRMAKCMVPTVSRWQIEPTL